MNVKTVEFGILVKGVSYLDVVKAAPDEYLTADWDREDWEEMGVTDKDKYVSFAPDEERNMETHPWNPDYVFVSFGRLEEDMPNPSNEAHQIMRMLRSWVPQAQIKWGVIHTER